MESVKFHIVIPARYASTRLPGKPIVDISGKPMVVRVYEAAKFAFEDEDVVVATDDQRIADVLDAYSVPWVMTRVDHESGTDRIAELCEKRGWSDEDVVINIQGDEPLVPVEMLSAFLAYCRTRGLDMATISAPIQEHDDIIDPNVVKVVSNRAGNASYFSRSPIPFVRDEPDPEQWSLELFRKHIGIYAYRVGVLKNLSASEMAPTEQFEKLEQLRALWLGFDIAVMQWKESPPHGVDTPEDVERVSRMIKEMV